MPPPPSGLPFNAQPNTKFRSSKHHDKDIEKVRFDLY